MIAMGVVVSVLILGRSGLRSTFLLTSSDHIKFDTPWYTHTSQWYTPFHVHYLHILLLSCYISFLERSFLFEAEELAKEERLARCQPTNEKFEPGSSFMMIMIMIIIIPLIQNNHTGPDILLKKTIQDVLNATLRFWFNFSNTPHKFCIDIERKKQKQEGRVIFFAI